MVAWRVLEWFWQTNNCLKMMTTMMMVNFCKLRGFFWNFTRTKEENSTKCIRRIAIISIKHQDKFFEIIFLLVAALNFFQVLPAGCTKVIQQRKKSQKFRCFPFHRKKKRLKKSFSGNFIFNYIKTNDCNSKRLPLFAHASSTFQVDLLLDSKKLEKKILEFFFRFVESLFHCLFRCILI